jgi:NH3-dependent NAD+ synthetase
VPEDEALFNARAQEVFAIQTTALARRMKAAATERLVIGVSGGIDSLTTDIDNTLTNCNMTQAQFGADGFDFSTC